MKTTLTIQESAELIKRGVKRNKASGTYVGRWEHSSEGSFPDPESVEPLFTLADLLSLLPKHIPFANAEWYLNIQWEILWGKWHVQYLDFDHDNKVVKEEEAPELIDALYLLTLAVINHVKLD